MKTITRYLGHDEICEFLDVHVSSVLAFDSFKYHPADKVWVLKMTVGNQKEIEELEACDL